ncbi:MAG TPA: galactose-1-phosphate uridylyltransferase, partial [Longimicrobiales bacterium]
MDTREKEVPHRRLNLLTGEHVLVSPHRMQRPWQGQVEGAAPEQRPQYDPACYLCPGNERAAGQHNAPYDSTYVFTNDFPAL